MARSSRRLARGGSSAIFRRVALRNRRRLKHFLLATSPLSLASSVVNTGSSIYTAIQVRQLKAMMETLQALQVATLGVSLVGVGAQRGRVSVHAQRF